MIRVLLIDDHEMVRMGLAAFLEAQPDIEVAGEASDGRRGRRSGRRAFAGCDFNGPCHGRHGRHRSDKTDLRDTQ